MKKKAKKPAKNTSTDMPMMKGNGMMMKGMPKKGMMIKSKKGMK